MQSGALLNSTGLYVFGEVMKCVTGEVHACHLKPGDLVFVITHSRSAPLFIVSVTIPRNQCSDRGFFDVIVDCLDRGTLLHCVYRSNTRFKFAA